VQFNKIKTKCKNDPNRLKIYYENSVSFKNLVDDLDLHVRANEFERIFFTKRILKTSKGFAKEWQEYSQRWQNEISICRIPSEIWDALIKDLPNIELTPEEQAIQEKRNQSYEWQTDEPDIYSEDYFEPNRHNGGQAVELAFSSLEWRAESELNSSTGDFHIGAEAKIGLEALEFTRDQIGVNFKKIFRRWYLAPPIYFHQTAERTLNKGQSSRFSCEKSLESALDAFVFGNDLAAFAMCRSVLEQVLKVYVPEKDHKGNKRDLNKLIIAAADYKIKNFDDKRIQKFRKTSNNVLHAPWMLQESDDELERDLVDFISTLKTLIEGIN